MSKTERDSESGFSEGDTVDVHIEAEVIDAYDDGALLVDADGSELMVYEGEYR